MSIHRAKKKTVAKTNIQQLFDDRNGGQIALRGYSYQFLYSCYLVLSLADENTFFCLEGIEDIDQIAVHSQEKAISHIQIKQSKDRQDASFLKPVLKNFLEAYLIDSNRTFKTTLALQTAFLLKDDYTPYQVLSCDNQKDLGNISQFFIARIKVGEKPLIILDNLDSHLREWNSLVQLMEAEIHHHFRVLVTSREMDWYNFSGDISNIQSIRIIKPDLSKDDAKEIFCKLKIAGLIHGTIQSWEKAWNQIADRKLLIEFIYLLTHGEMLSDRISAQMREIGSSSDGKAKCELLRKVCFADVCGIRLSAKALAVSQSEPFSSDFGEMLRSMESEFLIHINLEGSYIEGLHPVRSKHVIERLHQFMPPEETALAVLQIVNPSDTATFFSHLPEFKLDKEYFYRNAVELLWNRTDLSPVLSSMRGLFSGDIQEYFRQNKTIFDDADRHGGLQLISAELSPFMRFQELGDEPPTLDKMLEIFPDNPNLLYLRNLRKSAPPFQLNKTGFFTLSCQVYSKIMGCDFTEIEDTTSLSTIVELLYSIDPSLNYASKIPLERIWSNPQTYSIECMASLMHASYLGNRENYMNYVDANLSDILMHILERTKSLRIYTDDSKNAIHVEYILRLRDIGRGNEESVSRLSLICKMLPFYSVYCSDGIKPIIILLSEYSVPDDAHKEMPAKNLIISFHRDMNSLWVKAILSNYEFDTVSEWLKHWFDIRELICKLITICCNCLYYLLAGKGLKSLLSEFDKYHKMLSNLMVREARFPKENQLFGQEVILPKGLNQVRTEYFQSVQNVFNQFVHFILKEPKDQRLFLINLLAARSALLSMQLFFSSIPMENAMRELCNNLDGSEKPLLEKLYASCLFYQNHSSSKSFDKYQIPSWYNAYQKEKLDDAKKQLDWLSSNYTVVFPEKIYYQKALSYFPVVVYNLDKIQKDTQGGWLIKLIPFCDEPFDYIVILNGDEKHIISYAICIPKSFLDELKHSHEDSREIVESISKPYPVDVTKEMTDCFTEDFKIAPKEASNPKASLIFEIAEDLWIYSKYVTVLGKEENNYLIDMLPMMRKEIGQKLNSLVDRKESETLRAMCNTVFSGQLFGDDEFNAVVESTLK